MEQRIPFLICPFTLVSLFLCCTTAAQLIILEEMGCGDVDSLSLGLAGKGKTVAWFWLRRKKRHCPFSALVLFRALEERKPWLSACFPGLLSWGLATRNPTSFSTLLSMAQFSWRGLGLPPIPQTGPHLQPPAFKLQEETAPAWRQGPWLALPTAEAELQRAVQVSSGSAGPEDTCLHLSLHPWAAMSHCWFRLWPKWWSFLERSDHR